MVDCKEKDEQIRRLLDRNKQLSENDAELRIASQMDRDEKLKLADFIIDNSGDLDGTKSQIKEMFLFLDRSQLYLRIRFGILLIGGLILAKLLA
jgi:dephospho-CoA kinase